MNNTISSYTILHYGRTCLINTISCITIIALTITLVIEWFEHNSSKSKQTSREFHLILYMFLANIGLCIVTFIAWKRSYRVLMESVYGEFWQDINVEMRAYTVSYVNEVYFASFKSCVVADVNVRDIVGMVEHRNPIVNV